MCSFKDREANKEISPLGHASVTKSKIDKT